MKKIKLFETFAGIGTQKMALTNIGMDVEIVGMSEWYIDAILAYGSIHSKEKYIDNTTIEEKKEYLLTLGLSKNSFDVAKNLNGLKKEKIEELYSYVKEFKNVGTIYNLKGKDIKDVDLLTYSFPCTDLSTGGKGLGMKKGSGTRSGLLWEVERILDECESNNLPKVLLMENVKAIQSESNIEDFNKWKNFLSEKGYNNIVYDLTASDFGVPQKRRRIFMVSYLKKINLNLITENIKKYEKKPSNAKDYLELDYSKKEIMEEAEEATVNMTPSREKMWNINKRYINEERPFNTITTNLDRQNNAGMINYNSKTKNSTYRLLTAREVWKLMGVSVEDYEKVKNDQNFSYRKMIKLAGNAIVVDVLEAIFKEIYEN